LPVPVRDVSAVQAANHCLVPHGLHLSWQVGIQCYQPNVWQLSLSTRDSTE